MLDVTEHEGRSDSFEMGKTSRAHFVTPGKNPRQVWEIGRRLLAFSKQRQEQLRVLGNVSAKFWASSTKLRAG